MSIFTERDDDRMDKSQARNSIERRDELIEELLSACRLMRAHFKGFEVFLPECQRLLSVIEHAEREGYGQGPGAA